MLITQLNPRVARRAVDASACTKWILIRAREPEEKPTSYQARDHLGVEPSLEAAFVRLRSDRPRLSPPQEFPRILLQQALKPRQHKEVLRDRARKCMFR